MHHLEIESSILECFERIVQRYSDRLAVKTGSHTLTYDALDKASNRLTHALVAQRGTKAEPIALLLEHGIAPLVAILGILKSGKFYVALDPTYPYSRLLDILDDTQASLMVTNRTHLSLAKTLSQNKCQLITLEELESGFSDEPTRIPVAPDTLSAIFYTSGSTGQPKGVMRDHRQVLHYAMYNANDYHIVPEDHCSLLFPCHAGASTTDIFGSLLNGATLYPFSPQESSVDQLLAWLIQEEITVLHPPVILFRQLLDRLTEEEHSLKLRLITLAGQTVYLQDVARFKKHFPDRCMLISRLALTEAGAITHFFIDHNTEISGNLVPVGYEIDGKEVLLLDDTGKEVGYDCVGEIAVRSRYLAPGYWRKPELTQQIFLPDPEGGDKRIYLTGDLGHKRPDGCLEHLGRKDFQVKIRGYRVKLAEIETALYNLGTIKEAEVVEHEDQFGDTRLIAYVTPSCQPVPTVSELRRALATTLPEYMIPSTFVFLDALPLTPTGKIDRRALPKPDRLRPELENPFVPPTTPEEEKLTHLWAEILELDQVGIHDNFFELGGHSIQAARIISRIQQAFQVELPLQTLFDAPTVAELATIIVQKNQHRKATDEVLEHIITALENLSEEEAQRLLAETLT